MTEFVRIKDVPCEDCEGEGVIDVACEHSCPVCEADCHGAVTYTCSSCDGTGTQTIEEETDEEEEEEAGEN